MPVERITGFCFFATCFNKMLIGNIAGGNLEYGYSRLSSISADSSSKGVEINVILFSLQ
jgi:hypothetical protein